ncbi:hypothetical protein GGTG_13499 [Gaeumannomyces tritici R3-111a-1]|uniref:JmjC domain-containing protein n=1 Tax=Gaeumannomyces tritici (strain R3-111a-1) TaxID=644352 RepID=J3PJ17_GAET3|nr:hypothetical protein GGTG_13499 [Gaeumannomyces tritici R3-111a-1]EJT68906.1 hypothetical protein GGTG_13499 [Gaeumannomyces tritici R3-111a-1]
MSAMGSQGSLVVAEKRAENIERQLIEQYAKEIKNLRAQLGKLEAESERLKQVAEKAKRQAELELRQQITAGTGEQHIRQATSKQKLTIDLDAVSGAPASGPLSPSAASSTASSEQESSAGSTDSASTSSTSSSNPRESQSDAPSTKPAPLEVDPGSGRKTPRSFLPIDSPLGDAHAASSGDPDPQSSSGPAQDAADIDIPDAADAAPLGSNPGAQSPSSSSLSSPPIPQFNGPYEIRLNAAVKWGKEHFPEKGVDQFESGKLMAAAVLYDVCTINSWPVINYQNVRALKKKMENKLFAVILCHVQDGLQLSGRKPNHFVVAIVDWKEETLGDYTGNTCLLQCLTAVRSYFGEITPQGNQHLKRWFYLEILLQHWVDCHNEEATSADTQIAIAEGPFAAGPPLGSAGQHGNKAMVEGVPNDGSIPQSPQSAAHFTSAQFAPPAGPSRKPLPNGPVPATNAPAASPSPSNPDEVPQVQPTSVPPPLFGQGNDNDPAASHGVHNGVKYQWMPCYGGEVLVLEPTPNQYSDLKEGPKDGSPLLFTVAEELGARKQGAFIINTPKESRPVLPAQPTQTKTCTTYKPELVGDDFWRLYTLTATQSLPSLDNNPSNAGSDIHALIKEYTEYISAAFQKRSESIPGVAYQTDIPAHSTKERENAFLPLQSPIWHIRGNQLPREGIPGLHTPTAYRGTKGAPFAWHFENLKLGAINYLYRGRKVWFLTEPGSFDNATEAFSNVLGLEADHDQFLRHQALHYGIKRLQSEGAPTIGFMQEAWQMVVVYPGAYHSGFTVNYADQLYTYSEEYKPCDGRCHKDQEPITRELVFPPEAETTPADEEASSALRRSPRQVATLRPAPAKASMGSPRGPQKRKRSAGERGSAIHTRQRNPESHEPEDGQDGLQDEPPAKQKENTPSPQAIATLRSARQNAPRVAKGTSGKQHECDEQQGKTVESPRLRRNKRAAGSNEPPSDEPQSKRKPRPVAIMAEHLRDANAIARLRGHIRASRENGRLPELKVKEEDRVCAAVAYCKIAIQAKQSASYCGLRSWIAWASANKLINLEKEKANRKRNFEDVLQRAHAEVATLSYVEGAVSEGYWFTIGRGGGRVSGSFAGRQGVPQKGLGRCR